LNAFENIVGAFVNNVYTTNVTDKWQKAIKDNFMIYHSDAYIANREAGKWYKNMFSGEGFLAEGLESLGFTVGAIGAGVASGGLASASKALSLAAPRDLIKNTATQMVKKSGKGLTGKALANEIKATERMLAKGTLSIPMKGMIVNGERVTQGAITKAANQIARRGGTTNIISTAMSVMGEGRIEGVHAGQEFKEEQLQKLYSDEMQNAIMQEIEEKLTMDN
jgi:hypothetical protein